MRAPALVAVVALAIGLGACGGAAGSAPAASRDVNVFAAASLTESFTALAKDFEKGHAGTKVRLDFGGSSTLVQQIEQGAPADAFASADLPNMQKLVDAGVAGKPAVFARNRLAMVVARGNPKHVTGLGDLASPGLVVVLAAPGVPAGTYAQQALQKAGVRVMPRSQEQDVKAVVSKVALGEADAGIVYATDVRAGGANVEGVAIPDSDNVIASYPIAVMKTAANGTGAEAFTRYVLSPAGQRTLAGFGFLAP